MWTNELEVADEWGAVIQHHAEVEQQILEDEKHINRERQKKYKEDLDRQCIEATSKRSGAKKKENCGNLELFKDQREKELLERQKATKNEIMREMEEHQQYVMVEKSREQAEKGAYEQYLRKLEENEIKKKAEEQERKYHLASSLRLSYIEQEQFKKQKAAALKDLDKKLLEVEKTSWPHDDYEKKKVIN